MRKWLLLFAAVLAVAGLAGPSWAAPDRTDKLKIESQDGDYVRISSHGAIIQEGNIGVHNELDDTDVNGDLNVTGALSVTGQLSNTTRGLLTVHETWMDMVAVDSNTYMTDVAVDTATLGGMTTSFYAASFLVQPVHPRTLSFVLTDSGSNSTGTITVYGVNGNGDITSESLSFNAANTGLYLYSSNAYVALSTITLTYTAFGGVNSEKFWVGVSSGIGLANDLAAAADLIQAVEAGADATTGTLNTTYDTYLPASAPNGTRDYELWYKATSSP